MSRTIQFSHELEAEYERLFKTAVIRQEDLDDAEFYAKHILANKDRYRAVAAKFHNAPWWLIGVIHGMECDAFPVFNQQLANGESLNHRTTLVPAGLPREGSPPFTWEQGAVAALKIKGWGDIEDWTLGRQLYELERYNGFGYRLYHSTILSPYLWSFTTLYKSGKYYADSKWSDAVVSKQCGAVAMLFALKRLDPSIELETGETLETPVVAEPGKTVVPHNDYTTVLFVQTRLRDLGYFEVGKPDGFVGNKTNSAVRAFRAEEGLEPGDEITDEFLAALAKGHGRLIGGERANAKSEDIVNTAPAVKVAVQAKSASWITGIAAGGVAVVQGVAANVTSVKTSIAPLMDTLNSVPAWAWAAVIVAVAAGTYYTARKAETQVVDAYREGSVS